MAGMTMLAAIRGTILDEMERDERVVLLGEDVGANGGVFRATEGAFARFGPRRVFDTPLAESVIVGTSVGLSAGLVTSPGFLIAGSGTFVTVVAFVTPLCSVSVYVICGRFGTSSIVLSP